MTEHHDLPPGLRAGPTDIRRAAALLLHANPDDLNTVGVAAIVTEVKADLRITELLAAMSIIAYSAKKYPLSTPEGQQGLIQIISDYAPQEGNQ